MTDLLTVSQADREAAADVFSETGESELSVLDVRRGKRDDNAFVQAFARHRIAHQPTQDRDAVLEEAAKLAERFAARPVNGSYELAAQSQAFDEVATAIRALKDLSPYIGKEGGGG